WEAAAAAVHPSSREGQGGEPGWDARRIEEASRAYLAARGELLAFGDARRAEHTTLRRDGPRAFTAWQTMGDPEGENDWSIEVGVDLGGDVDDATPIIALRSIGG